MLRSIRLFGTAVLVLTTFAGVAHAEDDLSSYRDRFKVGFDKYVQGAHGEAIAWWEPIYRELGVHKGYRLAFNLARAYEKVSDFTLAAERYESFLTEVVVRREAKEELLPIVLREADEAEARLDELRKTKGRISVRAGLRPLDARIDEQPRRAAGFVAYVVPGAHVVSYMRENEVVTRREVSIEAGALAEVSPPAEPEPPSPGRAPSIARETVRPFSATVLFASAGVTLASVAVPAVLYANALSLADRHDASGDPIERARLAEDYAGARSAAYASLAIPVALAALTGGLTTFYFVGSRNREVVVGASGSF